MSRSSLVAIAAMFALSACAPATAPVKPPAPGPSPVERLAAVQAAAGGEDNELAVQPLRDPQVEDLRQKAERAMAAQDYAAAAAALDHALRIVDEDPAVLQERAEAALAQGEYEHAQALARKAIGLGSAVGPLCRRHWATIEQAQLARGLAVEAAAAHAKIEACTVAGVERM